MLAVEYTCLLGVKAKRFQLFQVQNRAYYTMQERSPVYEESDTFRIIVIRDIMRSMVWYGGMVFIYSTSLYIIYIAHHYNITQDAEREMHEVQYLYVAFP